MCSTTARRVMRTSERQALSCDVSNLRGASIETFGPPDEGEGGEGGGERGKRLDRRELQRQEHVVARGLCMRNRRPKDGLLFRAACVVLSVSADDILLYAGCKETASYWSSSVVRLYCEASTGLEVDSCAKAVCEPISPPISSYHQARIRREPLPLFHSSLTLKSHSFACVSAKINAALNHAPRKITIARAEDDRFSNAYSSSLLLESSASGL
eukprot:6178245-Pleurochrysis_carterae.AAC.2